ncbi:CE1759 family FMN reductase [Paeniglutamicibacter sp. Y32M11]|uniref:CE1759 family FMN reductase n=1 Tax=Paeniglutamicibacter sp. Y32M11 TaxID=2853258 RepID=UPI001C52B9C6|nr:CE1759 family FMN reductase [Paeniglutamicibacter sp. Y32M11]QXQ10977.1 NAD(P)H-dependent oxidoreductase [Paeniglutamicibacter sp. Y32M11]
MSQNIVVISGGLGTPSTSGLLGRQLGEATVRELAAKGIQADLTVLELRDYAVDISNNLLTGYAPPRLSEAIKAVSQASGLIAVSPVFTASVSGLFKSFIDVLDPKALEDKPVILAATAGSARHNLVVDYAMRPIFAYLRARIMPTSVFASPEDWGADQGQGALAERELRAGAEMALSIAGTNGATALTQDLGDTRSIAPRVSENANPRDTMSSLPFEQLLANIQSK